MPPYDVEHQHYRKLLGQKGLAEAWHRWIQKTCHRAEEGGYADLGDSELTAETLYALVEEAQANARTATSKLTLTRLLRRGENYELGHPIHPETRN